jgi:hypothetical protein
MRAFVLMPFREPFNGYYARIFKPALEAAGYTVERADDMYAALPVMLDIQDSIVAADMLLCEMSGRNPNVFYELGLAHAIGKPAILVSTTEDDIPFDLRHVRVISYNSGRAGFEEELRTAITKAARSTAEAPAPWPPPLRAFASPRPQLMVPMARSDGRSDHRVVDRPVNLGFDGAVTDGIPHGWFNSVGYVWRVSDRYAASAVRRNDGKPGTCLMLSNAQAAIDEFGSMMQRFPATFLAGRSIRYDGELKTKDVTGWAGLWIRADGDEVPNLVFDNMHRRGLRGTDAWARYALEVSLPSETRWLNIGVVLSGAGTIWADDLRLRVWNVSGHWEEI